MGERRLLAVHSIGSGVAAVVDRIGNTRIYYCWALNAFCKCGFRFAALGVGTFLISTGCANRGASGNTGHEYDHFVFKRPALASPSPSPFRGLRRSVSLYGATRKFPKPGPTQPPNDETQSQKVVRYIQNWALSYKDDAGDRPFNGNVSVNKGADEVTVITYLRDWLALDTDEQGIIKQNALDVAVESFCLTSMKQHEMVPQIIVRFSDPKGTVLASEATGRVQGCR